MRALLAAAAAACALLAAAPARAVCTAANTYNYSFNWSSNTGLNYASSYNYTASNSLGANQNFTLSFATNGLSSTVISGVQMPAVHSLISGTGGGRTLVVGGQFTARTPDVAANTRVIRVTFTFATPIRDFTVRVHDIDYSNNQYRDWLMVQGSNGASTYTPSMTTPFGTNNGAGPHIAAGSSLALGPYSSGGVTITNTQGVALSASANTNSNTGDIIASFAQPVTSVTLRYGNYPSESQTREQGYGISAISFCPLPAIVMAKSSAPYAASGPDRFNAPGSDLVYTLTVTNNGGSPVDLATLVLADLLPSTMTFYNGDFDPAAPGTDPFQLNAGGSGVTLGAADVAYSNNGGASYAYTPAAGYDAAVNALRFSPGGTMAANSSFTIKFRARVK